MFILGFLTVQYKFSVPLNQHEVVVQKIGFSQLQMLGVLGIFKAKGTEVYVFHFTLNHSHFSSHHICYRPPSVNPGLTS